MYYYHLLLAQLGQFVIVVLYVSLIWSLKWKVKKDNYFGVSQFVQALIKKEISNNTHAYLLQLVLLL